MASPCYCTYLFSSSTSPPTAPMSSPHHLFLITLLLLQLLHYSCYAGNSTAFSHQCSLLLDFKQQSFTNYSACNAWNRGTNCCHWNGVSCDPSSGMITGLDLSGCPLASIGPTLFNLTSLQTLNLAYCLVDDISNPFPNEFELLTNLTSLNLSNAGFSGQIPIGVSKLTKLVSLDLSTSYDGDLELKYNPDFETLIRNMSNLRELNLDGVNISSAHEYQWSAAVAKWTPKLTTLSLASCSITGPIHSSFAGLRNLSVIRLDYNELNCSVPDFFGNFSSLSEISLFDCGLNGVFPKNVFVLRNLKIVDLFDNFMLSGSLPDFPDASKLESLVICNTNFSGSLPYSIGKLQYLTAMQLSQSQFSGVVPSSISNLTQLVYLDLSNAYLSGEIATWIGNLTQLVYLNLQENMFNGSIPSSLFTLPSILELRLNQNQLSGHLQEFTNGSTSQLAYVDLSYNLLQGKIPRSIFQLSELQSLLLASNNFSGTLEPAQFKSARNLRDLDLSYNSISIQDVDSDDYVSLPQIQSLVLASCNLTKIPSFVRYQNQMSILDISNNTIVGAIPNWIWSTGNGSLSYLILSNNLFTSLQSPLPNVSMTPEFVVDLHSNLLAGPIWFPPKTIRLLDYSNNKFSSSIPSNITSYLGSTVFLSLANNSIVGVITPSICNASKLEVLDFSNNKLSGFIPPCLLEGNSSLRVLNLGGNQLQGTIPQNISQGCCLQTLNLNGNYLEGRLPQSLANCNSLELLDLGNNHINDHFPFWLGKIKSLRVLVLRSNKLYGLVEPPLGIGATNYYFPELQIFDISSNYFNGSLPFYYYKNMNAMMVNSVVKRTSMDYNYYMSYNQDSVIVTSKGLNMQLVKTLTIFTSIDFSNNNFEGIIPDIIGELKALIVLNISHNSLTGNIPPSIGKLLQLESLDLSQNKLSGNIPQELSDLTFLCFLNLSNNSLVGKIPQGNQLSTFEIFSFQGNKDLCGLPLTRQCNNATPTNPDAKLLPQKSNHSLSTYVILLALFIGVGFGGGIAVVFVLQNVT